MIIRLLPLVLFTALPTAMGADAWKVPEPAAPDAAQLTGAWGAAQARSAYRMAAPPLDKAAFILDDVALKQHRQYAEWSGDISGRWIGVAAFLRSQYPKPLAMLSEILAAIPACQKDDGHFGADQDLGAMKRGRDLPILWGNGRLLIGLVEVYEQTGDPKSLEAAKKLGDYFVTTDSVLNKQENLGISNSYAENFVTCYFSCIEGLVALGRVTKDRRYLDEGRRIAELALSMKNFDGLHSHGRLCAVRAFADLAAVTGDRHWLEAAQRDWKTFMERYRLPTGGIKEVLDAKCNRDEGCTECDWLRLSLSLWRLTGKGCYLDETERCLKGHFLYQQFPNGGAGHRLLHQIDGQPVAFASLSQEAWWCCAEHWARATADIARFAVTSGQQGPQINLAIDCQSKVAGPGGLWRVTLKEIEDGLHVTLQSPAPTKASVRIHRPAWAQQGARIVAPAGLAVSEAREAWLIEGIWTGVQEVVVHLPTVLRSEPAADGGVLLRGHDLLVAHRLPCNAWLMQKLPLVRPAVLWSAALPATGGRVLVPASLAADADPKRPEQWKRLELAPLRALTGLPHEAAWFSFRLRAISPEAMKALMAQLP
jgi:DUF1680 family protein